MKQILNNISRITLSIMREGRGVGLLLMTLLMMAMSPQNVWADDCDDCNGTGKTCGDCSGTGKETCGDCSGTGKENCGDCSGTGKENCEDCRGTGKKICEDCNGSGNNRRCEDCSGSGKDEDESKSCPRCGGDGLICDNCADSGYEEETCSTCKGSGKQACSTCDGSGGPTCSTCKGSGISSCSTCKGSGGPTCSTCNGSGKVAHEHQPLAAHPAVAATCTTAGNSAYWSCSVCGKYFNDAEGKNVIEKDSWVKPAVHNFANGACTKCGAAAPQFTYKAKSDLSSTFQSKFGSYGTVTCGTWTDANTPVTVTVNGTVTSIGNSAFFQCYALTSITIPSGVTSIGNYAFMNCSNLSTITLPSSVTSIGESAFQGCSNLTSITIPEGVTSIGNYAFHDCSNLTSITIPEGVTSIGKNAFERCSNLTSITIPEGVTNIGESTFDTCKGLTSVTLPSSVTSIDNYAFWYCENLTTLTVLSSNATLSSNALGGCSGLQTIYVPEKCVATYKAATNWSTYAAKIKAIPPTVPFDLAITKAGATEATLSKEMVKTITINKSDAGAAQVAAQSGTEVVTPTQLEHNTRYDFAITKVPTLNPGEDDLEGDIIAKAPRRVAVPTTPPSEPTLTGPTLVIGTATAYTTYPLDAEHTDIKVEMAANGNYKINGTEVQGVTSIYFVDAHVFTSETVSDTYLKSATCTTDAVYYHKCAGCDASSENNTNSTWTKAGSALGHNYANGICTRCGALQPKITYTASEKLPEATSQWSEGLHTNAFGSATIVSHTFENGVGTITFGADLTSIGDNAFYQCTSLTSVTIPSGVTSIGKFAFSGCSMISGITIPSSVTSIGDYAFAGCDGLQSITIPSSVTSIGEYAFLSCYVTSSNLHNSSSIDLTQYYLTIVDTEQTDGLLIKDNCAVMCRPGATSVNIPGSVTSIGKYAFYECASLTSITFTLPSSVTSIGKYAFYHCSNLTSITLPSSVTSIGEYAFYQCSNFTSITLPSSVTSIGANAFRVCTGLTSITLPSSVTSIDNRAFYECTNLTTVICKGATPATLGDGAFKYENPENDEEKIVLPNLNIYVPASSVSTYKAATNWSDYSSNITAITSAEVTVTTSDGTSTDYSYLPDAIAAATDGSTVKLNYDVTITANTYSAIEIGEDKYPTHGLTIDLDQNTLTLDDRSAGYQMFINKGNKITIKNGTLDCNGYGGIYIMESSLNLDGVNLDCKDLYPYYPDGDGRDGHPASAYAILATTADVVLNNSTVAFNGKYCYAFANNSSSSLTLTGTSKMDGNIELREYTLKAASTVTIGCHLYIADNYKGWLSIANGTFTAPTDYKWTAGSDGLYTFSQHKPVKVEAKEATCTEDGNLEHWKCSDCNAVFKDEACYNETTVADLTIAALGHNYDDCVCTRCGNEIGITIYTSVEQGGTKLEQLGTAAFKVADDASATLAFDNDGNAVMTIGGNTVAKVPAEGSFVMDFTTTMAKADLNKVSKTVTTAGYATLYSPFQLQVPAEGDVEVYAPTYDESTHTLKLNSSTKVNGEVIPAGTGLMLKNAGDATFTITKAAPTYTEASALTGSAVKIANPTKNAAVDGKTVYTLGKETTTQELGFFRYTGDYLNAGLAFLYVNTVDAPSNAKAISLEYDGTTTSLTPTLSEGEGVYKYLENGKVVIVRNGKKYNVNGQVIK